MSYGQNKGTGGFTGILSLLDNFGNKQGTGKEFKSFMDKDSGTEHHALKTSTRPAHKGGVSNKETDFLRGQAMNIKELQEKFATILGNLEINDQAQVIKAWSMSDDDGKENLMNMIVRNPAFATGYAIQDEQPTFNLGL